jgi:hypothetical protein
LLAALLELFEVDEDILARDVNTFLGEMMEKGLVHEE